MKIHERQVSLHLLMSKMKTQTMVHDVHMSWICRDCRPSPSSSFQRKGGIFCVFFRFCSMAGRSPGWVSKSTRHRAQSLSNSFQFHFFIHCLPSNKSGGDFSLKKAFTTKKYPFSTHSKGKMETGHAKCAGQRH